MRKSFKTALCTILCVLTIAVVLVGCAQAGDERALDPNGVNSRLDNGAANQGLSRNNLVGGRYGYNRNDLVGGRYSHNRNNTNNTNTNYTNYGMYGLTRRNTTGITGNTANDPANFISYNGKKTIENNNRFGRMSNNSAGMGSNRTNAANGNDRYKASMIERQLESINGINDCSVIVAGDTALVGLGANGIDAGSISGLRTSIERQVKQMDNSIKKVTVTYSPDMLTRIGRLGKTGNNGAANDFMQEFDNMVRSIGTAGK